MIDGAVKFAPGTVFQQPPNTKSQTLLGCFKNGVPLHDFVLGGAAGAAAAAAAKRERELDMDDARQVCSVTQWPVGLGRMCACSGACAPRAPWC